MHLWTELITPRQRKLTDTIGHYIFNPSKDLGVQEPSAHFEHLIVNIILFIVHLLFTMFTSVHSSCIKQGGIHVNIAQYFFPSLIINNKQTA